MHAIRTHSSVALLGLASEVDERTPTMKRRLTTVLCADACGYAGQMQTDEAGTLERLRRYRSIMGELFARHEGRMVNTWGDSIIAEFASVVEAVRCAVEIQEAIGAENAGISQEKQMQFRIGINLGDVIEDGDDIYGEGVNAAARLESLADPGGIMVSETVHALTHKQLSFTYDYAGSHQVKGQEAPITGYRVRMPGTVPGPPASAVPVFRGQPVRVNGRSSVVAWYATVPITMRLSLAMIALFFTINLFTGMRELWFVYPSMPFAALMVFRLLRGPK